MKELPDPKTYPRVQDPDYEDTRKSFNNEYHRTPLNGSYSIRIKEKLHIEKWLYLRPGIKTDGVLTFVVRNFHVAQETRFRGRLKTNLLILNDKKSDFLVIE